MPSKAYPLERDRASERFALTSEQCELLLAFETAPSLEALARALSRDASVLSRQLQRIAQETPALEKTHGRWRLTPLGKQLATWARDAIASQRRALDQPTVIRLASTREFTARVLAPRLGDLVPETDTTIVSLFAAEEGVERRLLAGEADIGFDCGRPVDPEIRFRQVTPEPFSVVAAPGFVERHQLKTAQDALPLANLPVPARDGDGAPRARGRRRPHSRHLQRHRERARGVLRWPRVGGPSHVCGSA